MTSMSEKTAWERDIERIREAQAEAVEDLDLEVAEVNYVSGKKFVEMATIVTRVSRDGQ